MEKIKIKADKRDRKKKPKMKVSGKSVFKLQEIIIKKTTVGRDRRGGANPPAGGTKS